MGVPWKLRKLFLKAGCEEIPFSGIGKRTGKGTYKVFFPYHGEWRYALMTPIRMPDLMAVHSHLSSARLMHYSYPQWFSFMQLLQSFPEGEEYAREMRIWELMIELESLRLHTDINLDYTQNCFFCGLPIRLELEEGFKTMTKVDSHPDYPGKIIDNHIYFHSACAIYNDRPSTKPAVEAVGATYGGYKHHSFIERMPHDIAQKKKKKKRKSKGGA